MKIIDEKGRLFGKINVIDFLVIIFLFCLTPMFYFGYKTFSKKPVITEESKVFEEPKVFTEVELDCKFIKIEPGILKLIAVGDKEIDKDGKQIGEIIWIGESKPYQYEFDIGSGEILTKEDPILKDLATKVKLRVEIKGSKLYYKDKQTAVGSPIDFKTNRYILTAIPVIEKIKGK